MAFRLCLCLLFLGALAADPPQSVDWDWNNSKQPQHLPITPYFDWIYDIAVQINKVRCNSTIHTDFNSA